MLVNTAIRTAAAILLAMILSTQAMAAVTGEPAPAFSLPDRTGQTMSLDDFKGQVVLINFWASWCGPCRQEMPLLDELHQRYGPLGFTLLGINVEEDSALADAFLKDMPVNFPVLFDHKNSVSKAYDVIAMPTTVILDREGLVRFVHYGYEAGYESDYQDQVRTLIRE